MVELSYCNVNTVRYWAEYCRYRRTVRYTVVKRLLYYPNPKRKAKTMLNIETTKTVKSKLFEGVSFTIAVWLDEHRLRQRIAAADATERSRDLQAEHDWRRHRYAGLLRTDEPT